MGHDKTVILCVDDDPDVLTYLKAILEAEGFSFLSAGCAEDGLHIFREKRPDALIVDMMMEEVDAGIGMAKQIRFEGSSAPIFMLSSVGDSLNYTLEVDELGLSGIFQKPLRKEHLLPVLKVKLSALAE